MNWKTGQIIGVEGHVHARNPWTKYHEMFPEKLAPILGALEGRNSSNEPAHHQFAFAAHYFLPAG